MKTLFEDIKMHISDNMPILIYCGIPLFMICFGYYCIFKHIFIL